MIIEWSNKALAVLVDGRVLIGLSENDRDRALIKWHDTDPWAVNVAQVQMGRPCETYAILTKDGRLLMGYWLEIRPEDITPSINKALGTVNVNIDQFFMDSSTLVIRTGNDVHIISVDTSPQYHGKPIMITDVFSYSFHCETDLFNFGYDHGLVRTTDNRLFRIGNMHRYGKAMRWPLLPFLPKQELIFHDTANIEHVYIGTEHTLLHMRNGSVYEQGLTDRLPTATGEEFEQVCIPGDESVVKIRDGWSVIYYFTPSGLCYYHQIVPVEKTGTPVLIKCLVGMFVEKVYGSLFAVTTQSGERRLCRLKMRIIRDGRNSYEVVDDPGSNTRPYLEHYPNDDENLEGIARLSNHTYFITSDGGAYTSEGYRNGSKPYIVRDPFFDTNPLAIERQTLNIRSARSRLDDDQ